ncbi:MAG: hypothetical protein JWM57_3753 [Phycisphaerales bacterium]|nr:hypothetical protein [Phycisphaerales bacterium]
MRAFAVCRAKHRVKLFKLLRLAIAAMAATAMAADSPTTQDAVIYTNDFKTGLDDFQIDQEQPASVTAKDGALVIDAPAGITVWLKQKLSGSVVIEYDATAISRGGANDRVSDLNCFWMADDAKRSGNLLGTPRSGKFADYDTLTTYYVGYGGNSNTTTRFRRYIGERGNRPLRAEDEFTDVTHLLTPNVQVHIKLVASDHTIEYWRDGERLFALTDADPYRDGWFGFRTVKSHLEIRNLRIHRPA